MNQTEQKNEDINLKQDLWQEYIDSIDEEKTEEETPSIHISSRVEEDLLDYATEGKRKRRTARSTHKKTARNRTAATVAIPIALGTMIVSAAVIFTTIRMVAVNNTYEYDPDIEEVSTEAFEEEWDMPVGEDAAIPELTINDRYYQLPVKLSDFLQDDWKVSERAFSQNVTEVGEEPVELSVVDDFGDKICDVMVCSPSGETIPLSDATVIGISIESRSSVWVNMPGGLSTWSSSYSIENILRESNVEWIKKGSGTSSVYEVKSKDSGNDQYDYHLTIEMDDDSAERITMLLSEKTE